MLINVNKILDKFSKLVKEKKYDRIEYNVWRKLVKDQEANITYKCGDSAVVIHWEGKITGYKKAFSLAEKSFGKYLWDEIMFKKPKLDLNVDTTALKTATTKANDAMASLATAISIIDTTAIDEAWAKASNYISTNMANYTYYNDPYAYTNQTTPNLHLSQAGLYIDGKKLDDITDEATGASVKRKENDTMDLFKGFEFGSCKNDNVKVSMYGIAVKNATGTWVSYDAKAGNVMDVDILNFDAKYLYKMPVAIKDVKVGDTLVHNRKPVFVTAVDGGKLLVIDPAAGEEKIVLFTRSPFGFDFVTKIVNLFEGCFDSASMDNPFGNILPLMLMNDNENSSKDLLPLFMLNGNGNNFAQNPMMLYFLLGDKANTKDDLLPLLFLNGGNFGVANKANVEK